MRYDKDQGTLAAVDEAALSESEAFEDESEKFSVFISYSAADAPQSICDLVLKGARPIGGAISARYTIPQKWAQVEPAALYYQSLGESYERAWRRISHSLTSLKSQYMAEPGAMIAQAQEDLIEENSRLNKENDTLKKENSILRSRIEASQGLEDERLCVFEKQTGTVTEKVECQIEVTYELPEGPLKQVYNLDASKGGKSPSEGDLVEARLSLVVVDRPAQSEADFDSPLQSFEDIKSVDDPHI